ncbi:MAG TPA: BPL-N domain-containing protein [Mycobacteriales bacterium]|jgi:glutamine amidotransferase-like uncharacterized protein|nr:BPL-N domain-containing protein [Mycobacteriales bacterium]
MMRRGGARRALVYRGPAACEECPEALAGLLRSSEWAFDVEYVGPGEDLDVAPATLATAALYAQPGGGDSVERAYRQMKGSAGTIRRYVRSGGRYLGVCMGGYLAGHWRGLRLLPEDTDQFITSPGAGVTTAEDTLVDVDWRGRRHRMFFQDGPVFRLPASVPAGVTVLARYTSNGEVAAMVAPFGRGKVGVVGPHPEAPDDWYDAHGLTAERSSAAPLGHDLIAVLMSP